MDKSTSHENNGPSNDDAPESTEQADVVDPQTARDAEFLSNPLPSGNPGISNIIVTSLPKSGTHFAVKFCQTFGARKTGLHMCPNVRLNEALMNWQPLGLTTEALINHIATSAATVSGGHLPYDAGVEDQIARLGIKVLFMTRNPREVAISSMRFITDVARNNEGMTKRWPWVAMPDGPEKLLAYMETAFLGVPGNWEAVKNWSRSPVALALRYETLVGDDGEEAQLNAFRRVAEHIGADEKLARGVVEKSLFTSTPTMTSGRSIVEDYWSDEIEKAFEAGGGVALVQAIQSAFAAAPE